MGLWNYDDGHDDGHDDDHRHHTDSADSAWTTAVRRLGYDDHDDGHDLHDDDGHDLDDDGHDLDDDGYDLDDDDGYDLHEHRHRWYGRCTTTGTTTTGTSTSTGTGSTTADPVTVSLDWGMSDSGYLTELLLLPPTTVGMSHTVTSTDSVESNMLTRDPMDSGFLRREKLPHVH